MGLSVVKPGQANRAYDVLVPKFFKGPTGATYHGNGRKLFPS